MLIINPKIIKLNNPEEIFIILNIPLNKRDNIDPDKLYNITVF